jgi:hypothetical protein
MVGLLSQVMDKANVIGNIMNEYYMDNPEQGLTCQVVINERGQHERGEQGHRAGLRS